MLASGTGPTTHATRPARPPRLASVRDKTIRPRKPISTTVGRCPECQSNSVISSAEMVYCADCATVLSEINIVSEVTFGESSSGAAVVQGAYVGEGQRHAKTDSGWNARIGRSFNAPRESREVSESNGREELKRQQTWHHLPDHIFDRAFGIYKLALGNGFNSGRALSLVAAVCLYAACRREPEGQMLLIDFAEGITVNVFRVGQTWQDLKKRLFLEDTQYRPVMDVEDMVARFTKKLEFGRDMKKVTNDALLILRRMKRDWMVTGRRPNGLIGACIILAARMNNYRRTVREVVYVVKVADMTVAKRLEEFGRTASATMTVDEFKEKGLRLKQGTPPVIYERRAREAHQSNGKVGPAELLDVDETWNTSRTSRDRPTASSSALESVENDSPRRQDADGFAIPNLPHKETTVSLGSSSEFRLDSGPATSVLQNAGDDEPAAKRRKTSRKPDFAPKFSEEDLISEQELEMEMEVILSDTKEFIKADEEPEEVVEAAQATAVRISDALRAGVTSLDNLLLARPPVSEEPQIREEEFEDDPEVANCLLNEEERGIKERIWVTHNEDWLRSQQAKMLKKALDEAHGTDQKKKDRKKKKRRGRMGDGSLLEGTPALTASDAAKLMLEKHAANPSRHINYANLDKLYASFNKAESTDAASTRADSAAPSEADSNGLAPPASFDATPEILKPNTVQENDSFSAKLNVGRLDDNLSAQRGASKAPGIPKDVWDSDEDDDDGEDDDEEDNAQDESMRDLDPSAGLGGDEFGDEDETAGFTDNDSD